MSVHGQTPTDVPNRTSFPRLARRTLLGRALLLATGGTSLTLSACAARPFPWQNRTSSRLTLQRQGELWTVDNPQVASAQAPWQEWAKHSAADYVGGAKVSFQQFATEEKLDAAVRASVAAGSPPGALAAPPALAASWWQQGMLLALDSWMKRDAKTSADTFVTPVLDAFRDNGQTFGLPQPALDFLAIFVNLPLIKRAGLLVPPKSYVPGHACPITPGLPLNAAEIAKWGWRDLATNANQLTRGMGTGQPAFSYRPPDLLNFTTWLYSNGGRFYRSDKRSVVFDQTQGVQTLHFLASLPKSYHLAPFPTGVDPKVHFAQGHLPLLYTRASDARGMQELSRGALVFDTLGVSAGPSADRSLAGAWSPGDCTECLETAGYASYGSSTTTWSPAGLILRGAPQTDWSWGVLRLASSLASAETSLRSLGQPAPLRESFTSNGWLAMARQNHAYASWRDIAASGGPFPALGYQAVNSHVSALLLAAYAGKANIAETVDSAAKFVTGALQR